MSCYERKKKKLRESEEISTHQSICVPDQNHSASVQALFPNSNMNEGRKWEYLDVDCLMNIFTRVGHWSLLLDVPFVCKSWYKASLNPLCWSDVDCLRFPDIHCNVNVERFTAEFQINNFSFTKLLRLMLHRSGGKCTSVSLRRSCGDQDFELLVEKCPELKDLTLGSDFHHVEKFIGKLEHLERLSIYLPINLSKIIAQIGHNCKKFNTLHLWGRLRKRHARSIAEHLPKLKNLTLFACETNQESLEIILRGCKELEYFDVNGCAIRCEDFECIFVNDCYVSRSSTCEERLKELGSHVETFKFANVFFREPAYVGENDSSDSDYEAEQAKMKMTSTLLATNAVCSLIRNGRRLN